MFKLLSREKKSHRRHDFLHVPIGHIKTVKESTRQTQSIILLATSFISPLDIIRVNAQPTAIFNILYFLLCDYLFVHLIFTNAPADRCRWKHAKKDIWKKWLIVRVYSSRHIVTSSGRQGLRKGTRCGETKESNVREKQQRQALNNIKAAVLFRC